MIKKWMCLMFSWLLMGQLCLGVSASGSITLEDAAGSAALCLVGKAEGSGYRLEEAFGGGYLTFDDTMSPELAQWLRSRVDLQQTQTGTVFPDLQEGLYLAYSLECDEFAPFLIIVPWDGYIWDIRVRPDGQMPETGDATGIAMLTMAASGALLTVLKRHRKKD